MTRTDTDRSRHRPVSARGQDLDLGHNAVPVVGSVGFDARLIMSPRAKSDGSDHRHQEPPGTQERALTAAVWFRTVARVAGPSIAMRIEFVVTMTPRQAGHA
jgi:hypothetical protein